MKKTIKLLAIAAIASLTIVSCNNNATPADSTATENEATIEQTTEETQEEALVAETPDSIPAAEEQAAPAAQKSTKKAVKKEEPKAAEPAVVKEEVKTIKDQPAAPEKVTKTGKKTIKPNKF